VSNVTDMAHRITILDKKILCFIFGLIMWPIIIATPPVISAYFQGLLKSELELGEIPKSILMLGLISGLFTALIFIAISYLIAFIIKKFKKSALINGPFVFFIITCLLTVLFISSYGKTAVDVIKLEKDNVEMMKKIIKEF